jgi:rhodanese-related sulfurtransferase
MHADLAVPSSAPDTFAGAERLPLSVSPPEAWALLTSGQAVLVDVRTPEEFKFVGQVPGSINVPWATGTGLTRNPRFVRELEARVGGKTRLVLLMCRGGKRTELALDVALKAGFTRVSGVREGFEGSLDEHQQRGGHDGWRFHGLPWTQD